MTHPSRIDLDPADFLPVTYLPHAYAPLPAPRPFDREAALKRVRALSSRGRQHTAYALWNGFDIPANVGVEEARFWLFALTESGQPMPPMNVIVDRISAADTTRTPDRAGLIARLQQTLYTMPAGLGPVLRRLLSPAEFLDLLLDRALYTTTTGYSYHIHYLLTGLLAAFRDALPTCRDQAERDALNATLRARLDPAIWTQSGQLDLALSAQYRLACILGLHGELEALANSWADDAFTTRQGQYQMWRWLPYEVVFGLGSAALVERHMRRLSLFVRTIQEARVWLAHTGLRGPDFLVQSILKQSHASSRSALIRALCLVKAPEVVRPLLELRAEGQSNPDVRKFFESETAHVAAGCVPLAAGRGKLADAARAQLRDLRRKLGDGVITTALGAADPAVAEKVHAAVLADPVRELPLMGLDALPRAVKSHLAARAKPKKPSPLPDWLTVADLPPLVVEGHQLAGDVVARLMVELRSLELHTAEGGFVALADAVFREIREATTPADREAFTSRLWEQWSQNGAPPRDVWSLNAACVLAGDAAVLPLTAMVRDWTGSEGKFRTKHALSVLAALGTPLALQQLQGLARSLKARPLRDAAKKLVEAVAEAEGVSRAELEDRAAPTLGFEGDGPVFTLGARVYRGVLSPSFELLARDATGKVRKTLPAAGARDDAEAAKRTVEEWRRLRKTLQSVFREQAARLERAMTSAQRWTVRSFRDRVLGHPLLSRLGRLVLWGGYDDRGRLARPFRLDDEGACVDADGDGVPLDDFNSVRVVHPIDMTAETRAAWAEVFADHEIVCPFPQLGRALYPLEPGWAEQSMLDIFAGRKVNALTLSSLVKAADWLPTYLPNTYRGEAHFKTYPCGLTAVVHHPYIGGRYSQQAEQEMQKVFFLRDYEGAKKPADPVKAIRLKEVPDLVRNDTLETLTAIARKGKPVEG